jgi:arylsulfatase A-like enzyme
MLGSRWFYVVAVAGMVALFVASQLEWAGDRREQGDASQIAELHTRDDLNVLFILIDTLRSDRLGTYGYERDTSPTIDALAATGVRFAQQMAQSSWTKCSMASMWTGLYPVRTDVTRSPQAVSPGALMPAEILSEAGFNTFALWRNGWIGPAFGFHQGFDVYHSPRLSRIPADVRREKPTLSMGGTDQDTVRSAIEFLRTQAGERWFLYLHLMDIHQYVYDADTALFGTSYSDIYDNSIRWVDRILSVLINELDDRGFRENTLVVIAADHGEAFGEHGREGHARDVHSEVTTTPWIMSFPFQLEGGIVVEAPTENVDIWPTLLDLLGLPAMEGIDGRSQVPEILAAARGETAPEGPPEIGYAHLDQNWGQRNRLRMPTVAVVEDGFRYVMTTAPGKTREELFDASADPREPIDVIDEQAEVAERLRKLADEYLDAKPPWSEEVETLELDEMQLNQLRALGYKVP